MQRSTVTRLPRTAAPHDSAGGLQGDASPLSLEIPQSAYFYAHRLNMYENPPDVDTELPLDDFEQWALDRISVLDALDNAFSKHDRELERDMRPVLNTRLPLSRDTTTPSGNSGAQRSASIQKERFKDVMSHFILRLAFCQKSEDRQRFVRLETRLFRLRYEMMSMDEQKRFVQDANLSWPRATPEEIKSLEPQLRILAQAGDILSGLNSSSDLGIYYRVPMEAATDLLRRRRVLVRRGHIYVPESMQLSMLAKEFSRRLSVGLEGLARHRSKFRDDSRVEPVLQLMNHGFARAGLQSSQSTMVDGKLTVESLDELDRDNFLPLCASVLHNNLKSTKHAFNNERLQYQIFLRNMGMPVEEAVRLYRRYYSTESKLSQIEYGVMYAYGLKGSRREHGPQSCMQIYNSGLTAASNQAHGCPFQRLSPSNLEKLLKQHHISEEADLLDVQRLVKEKQLHLACSKVYELTHREDKTQYDTTITSPNMYFERAWKASKDKAATARAK